MDTLYMHIHMTGQLVGPFAGQDEIDWFMNQMECEGIEVKYLEFDVINMKFETSAISFMRSQFEVAEDMAIDAGTTRAEDTAMGGR